MDGSEVPKPSAAEVLNQPITADSRITAAFAAADDDAVKIQRETASEYVRENQHLKAKLRSPSTWAGGLFNYLKFNLGDKYYKYQKAHEVEAAQIRTGIYFQTIDSVTGAVREVNNARKLGQQQLSATAERFALAAEGKTKLQINEQAQSYSSAEINKKIGELLSGFARGEIDTDQFGRRRQKIVEAIKQDPNAAQFIRESNFVGENLYEVALQVKLSYKRGLLGLDNLDNLDQKIDLQLGQAVMASTTNADYNAVERVMNWTKGGKYRGWAANPLVAGVAVGLATSGIRKGLVYGAGIAIAPVIGVTAPLIAGVVVGAAFAAGRKLAKDKSDRQQHEREATYSKTWTDNRRTQLEEFRSNRADNGGRVSAEGLRTELKSLSELDLSVESNRNSLLSKLAEIDARINYGIENGVDLMTFTDRYGTETQKLTLIKNKYVALEKTRQALRDSGVSEADITSEIDTVLNNETSSFYGRFGSTQQEQDRRFNIQRAWRAGGAALLAAVTGTIGAVAMQEIAAVDYRISGVRSGDTLLEKAWQGKPLTEWAAPTRLAGFGADQAQQLFNDANPGRVEVDNGIFLVSDGNKHFELFDSKGTNPTFPVEVDQNGKITVYQKFWNLPDTVRNALIKVNHGQIPVDIEGSRPPGFGVDLAQRLFQNGGEEQLAPGFVMKVLVDMNGNRTCEIHDLAGNVLASPAMMLQQDGKIVFSGDFQSLPPNLKAIFGGDWQQNQIDKSYMPDFNADKARDFAQNYLKYGGKLGLNGQIDYSIDPESANHLYSGADHAISFVDKAGNPVYGAPMWQAADGRLIVAGDYNFQSQNLTPEARSFLAGLGYKETDEHSLRKYMQDLAANGPLPARDEVVKQGNFLLNTHDLHTGYLNQDIDPKTGLPLHNTYDQWAPHGGKDGAPRIDPFTGKTEVGKMSLNFKPENIWFNGFLQQDGKIHVDPNFLVDQDNNNTRVTPEQWTRMIKEMRQEGWTVDSHPNGYLITPPGAVEYTPPSMVKLMMTELTPPPAPENLTHFEITPLPPEFAAAPELIPTPLEKWSPLEKAMSIYGYGAEYSQGAFGLLDWEDHQKRRSPTLLENPNAELDEKQEVNRYLAQLSPEYRQELQNLNEVINSPLSQEARIVVTIPAYEEAGNIRKTLDYFLSQKDKDGQPLNPNLFEIIIVDNHPSNVPKDGTEDEINKFSQAHPDVKVRYVHKEWEPGKGGVGKARKYAADLALMRSFERPAQDGDLIVVSFDADVDGISNNYISEIINEFDNNPDLDALTGKWDLPQEALNKPNLRAAERLWYFLDRIIQRDAIGNPNERQLHVPGLIGRNTAFRGSTYSAIGGYNPEAKLAEDLEVGWMIATAREWDTDRFDYLNKASVVSNPRRFLAAMVQGVPLVQMYGNFHENRDIRQLKNSDLLARIPNSLDVARLTLDAEALWQAGQEGQYKWINAQNPGRFEDYFNRAMNFLGVEYVIENGHVKITNTNKLQQGLDRAALQASRPSPGSGTPP